MEAIQSIRLPEFTTRELEILHLLGRAYSRKQIYETLNMAERTLNTHTNHISIKTGCHGYAALVRYAQEQGYGTKQSTRTTDALNPSMLKPTKTEVITLDG